MEINMMINGNKADLPSKHIDGKFCGDGRHKVEEEHPYQREHQVCLPSNPEKTYNYMTIFLQEQLSISSQPVCQRPKDKSTDEKAKHQD